jgi:hypothetical protein
MKAVAHRATELLRYEPTTGLLYWKASPNNRKVSGSIAGTLTNNGYLRVGIDGRQHSAHRLIWLLVHGEWPPACINHINGVKDDNRIANLEMITIQGNGLHAYRLGLRSAKGEQNGRAKLTEAQVESIRSETKSAAALAAQYGMSQRAIRDILSRRTWSSPTTEQSA